MYRYKNNGELIVPVNNGTILVYRQKTRNNGDGTGEGRGG